MVLQLYTSVPDLSTKNVLNTSKGGSGWRKTSYAACFELQVQQENVWDGILS